MSDKEIQDEKEIKDETDMSSEKEDNTERKRALTSKGKELFYSRNKDFVIKIEKLENKIVQVTDDVKHCTRDLKQLQKCRESLNNYYHLYNQLSTDHVAFLVRTNTEESDVEYDSNMKNRKSVQLAFDKITTDIDNLVITLIEELSTSRRTKGSRVSSDKLSVKIAEKKARSEGAKAALEYVTKETELLKKQALLEAEKTMIEHQKLCAVLNAEVKALEDEGNSQVGSVDVPVDDPQDRTKKYVNQLENQVKDYGSYEPPLNTPRDKRVQEPDTFVLKHSSTPLNPHAAPYVSQQDVSQMFLRKELLLQRLTKFDDTPEFYTMWKTSFKKVVSEVNLSENEELDLLSNWLGQKSLKHANNIRRSNINSPVLCLRLTWERLDEKFGSPESILSSLEKRLDSFSNINSHDFERLYDLYDLLAEIEGTKRDHRFACHLSYFDSPAGINPIVNKLPIYMRDRWESRAFKYKDVHHVTFPPFTELVEFIHEMSRLKNDPSFSHARPTYTPAVTQKKQQNYSSRVQVRKTTVENRCPVHNTDHSLADCVSFKSRPYSDKIHFMQGKGLCFKCCQPKHLASECTEAEPKCADCGGKHITALHMTKQEWSEYTSTKESHKIKDSKRESGSHVSAQCTEICDSVFSGKSCGKTLLVNVHHQTNPKRSVKLYAIIDDQSNSCLVTPRFFDVMGIKKSNRIPYSLSTCAGITKTSGRRATGFQVSSITGDCTLDLPTLIECQNIPNFRTEIATPAVAQHHKHLTDIADSIPPLDDSAEILMLIGRNMTEAFHVKEQRIGPGHSPYAQRLPLGWVVIGETCLGKQHVPDTVNANKTYVMDNGRPTLLKPCSNRFLIKEDLVERKLESDVFKVTRDDNKPGLSTEDRQFLDIMDNKMRRNEEGTWTAPLPLRNPRPTLPNNRPQAKQRAKALHHSLSKDHNKKKQMLEFMDKIISAGHAEVAPAVETKTEAWYLPLFGVRHPQKPEQIRGVYDASAAYDGLSLNSVLLQGPDLMNRLLHVLLSFRRERVAIMGDIEKMFYCFQVDEQYRNFLRFFWYQRNDPQQDMIEYRMRVHVFGNKSSPAVATYGLRRIAESSAPEFGEDVRHFIHKNFYVDDGLTSLPTEPEAIDLLKRTQDALKVHGNIRFHKFASNSAAVMEAFPAEDRIKDLQNIDMDDLGSPYSIHRSLGVSWNVTTDMFTLHVPDEEKPFTKRGILSTIGSIYDPLGFFSPVTVKGRLIMRDVMTHKIGWDDPLASDYHREWENWKSSLKKLETVVIPRTFVPSSFRDAVDKKLLVYCDASTNAIAAISYLKATTSDGQEQIGFVMGKVKIAPSHGHTIPRLELCAAVVATELAHTVCESLEIDPFQVCFYSDSKIVLGCLTNRTKRFQVYVSNRISKILTFSNSDQWNYVPTKRNPADDGTRTLDAADLADSKWLKGPQSTNVLVGETEETDRTEFVETEVVSEVSHFTSGYTGLGTDRFQRFSSWINLVNAVAQLKHMARCRHDPKHGQMTVSMYTKSEVFVIREVQHEWFSKEINCLKSHENIPKDSHIVSLNPYLDSDGLLHVGGRLNRKTDLDLDSRNPLILPKKSHVSRIIVQHFHDKVRHQGRQLTEGAIRSGGYWILGVKRLISSLIHQCVTCRKLRGRAEPPKMADLPSDRLDESPPFTYVGLDTFGPWNIVSRRTRGGHANSKRWVILFSCMVTRAVHLEVVDEMSTSAFINALRRFIAIRGEVKQLRSDRGTNFIGSVGEMNINAINIEDRHVKSFMKSNRIDWIFNPPHASHMGGVWERMIGICRNILNSMLSGVSATTLTHDVLVTLMAEVSAIINSRPIVSISTDPDNPSVLSPSVLLTQKSSPVSCLSEDYHPVDTSQLYRVQWKRVQQLADRFWARWRSEYLHTLQSRRKWHNDVPNLQPGDVVLLKDKEVPRNNWPMAVVKETLPSHDGCVRTVTVRTVRNGKVSVYTRPVIELIPLLKVKN